MKSKWSTDPVGLAGLRLGRLRDVMRERGVRVLLTADPINIVYATGVRNMTIFSMMGASRFALIFADGPVILWELAGSEHLARVVPTVDEVRTAPGITALAGPGYHDEIVRFADEVKAELAAHTGSDLRLGVERFDHPVTDGFRAVGLELDPGTDTFVASRLVKLPEEIAVIRDGVAVVEAGVEDLRHRLAPGMTEVELWAHFQRHLIVGDGEFVSTRLVQAGERTFPYFQEASTSRLADGDLFCIDTDAIGVGGYGVDLSRTFYCGDGKPTARQRDIHALALEQLQHNSDLLEPGRSFDEFTAKSWDVPDTYQPFGYYCLAHGLGMSGEFPYIPAKHSGGSLTGQFVPGMVVCVESYIGDEVTTQGVKLEDQFLITGDGAERLTTLSLDLI